MNSGKQILKISIYITCGLFALVSFLLWIFDSTDIVKWISLIATVAQLLVMLYCDVLWKVFNVFRIKKVYGKYTGTLNYKYNNKLGSKNIDVEIKQSLFRIKVSFSTDEIKSRSFASFYENEDGEVAIYYFYKTYALNNNLKKNPPKVGSTRLFLNEEKKSLNGKYWSEDGREGTIELIKCAKKDK
jgi:hypothetical protein